MFWIVYFAGGCLKIAGKPSALVKSCLEKGPTSGSLNGRENVAAKNGPFSLVFSQIVALLLPDRSVFAGRPRPVATRPMRRRCDAGQADVVRKDSRYLFTFPIVQ
jgi:hypothetical protein